MKTRKQKSPASRRARHSTTKHGPARSRPATGRRKAASGMRRARRPPEDGALTLAANCTVAEVDTLKSVLTRRLNESDPVTLDVSALQRIDTAGLQLLAAFVRDRRTAGRAIAWRGRAPALEAAAGLLGLHLMLELPGEGR
jgi:ABC-type transporter Mla MlaB component